MRVGVTRRQRRKLSQGAALLLVGGLAAGCSSGVSRFTDETFTGSTTNQTSIINAQPQPQSTYVPPAATDGTYTSSVSRSAIEPATVARTQLPAPSATPIKRAAEPVRQAAVETAKPTIDPLSRAEERLAATDTRVKKAEAKVAATKDKAEEKVAATKEKAEQVKTSARVAAADPAGWSRTGGSQITAKEGETVFNLSRRYGVPADVLMKVNGLDDSGGLKVGQKVIIPTYIYSDRAPVSAPDHNPKVADAKSSRGVKSDTPDKAPIPVAPAQKLAVLPATPKLKETPAAAQTASADAKEIKAPPAPKVVAVVPSKGGGYTVAQGDSLSKIARKHGVSVAALKAANGGSDALHIGQQLKIPAGGDSTAVASAAPAKIDTTQTASIAKQPEKLAPASDTKAATVAAYTPPAKTKAIEAVANDDDEQAPDDSGIGKMRWPAKGRVAKVRDGIDIALPEGTPVKAAENGVVIYAGDGLKDFGNTVLVRHENGLVTVYGHADKLNVKRGQKVKRGEEIATSGMSGDADTPKLHFEVRKDSSPVDPSTYLQ